MLKKFLSMRGGACTRHLGKNQNEEHNNIGAEFFELHISLSIGQQSTIQHEINPKRKTEKTEFMLKHFKKYPDSWVDTIRWLFNNEIQVDELISKQHGFNITVICD